MRKRGFSIVELLVAAGIFLALVAICFGSFEFGLKAAHTVNLRHNLQASASRVVLSLQNDLRRSSFASLSLEPRTYGNVRRDGLCTAAMSNWNDPAAFNPTYAIAAYDRFVVYYATTEEEAARLIRSVYAVPRMTLPLRMEGFTPDTHMKDDPKGNGPGQLSYATLCDEVREFSLTDGGPGSVRAALTLHRSGTRMGGDKRHDQSYQIVILVTLENSFPKD